MNLLYDIDNKESLISMNKIVEVCCGSYTDCLSAFQGGALRVELNSALSVGGLTPSTTTLKKVKEDTDLKVICMVRSRAAGFAYTSEELQMMFLEAKDLLDNGADGIAFGFLNADKTINIDATSQMVELIHSYKKEAVFHRAFDVTDDPYTSIEALIELGVERLLTSGQKEKAIDGIGLIKDLQNKYGNQIQILAASGVNETNVEEIFQTTLVNQVHSSCKEYKEDPTTSNKNVSYSYLDGEHKNDYDIVSEEKVRKLVEKVNNL